MENEGGGRKGVEEEQEKIAHEDKREARALWGMEEELPFVFHPHLCFHFQEN